MSDIHTYRMQSTIPGQPLGGGRGEVKGGLFAPRALVPRGYLKYTYIPT